MLDLTALLAIVKRKQALPSTASGPTTAEHFLTELVSEVEEVRVELKANRHCHLEDELGDVLWDYLNTLACLEADQKISPQKVLERAKLKYQERVAALEKGDAWADVKQHQKARLDQEADLVKKQENTPKR